MGKVNEFFAYVWDNEATKVAVRGLAVMLLIVIVSALAAYYIPIG